MGSSQKRRELAETAYAVANRVDAGAVSAALTYPMASRGLNQVARCRGSLGAGSKLPIRKQMTDRPNLSA